MRVVMLDTDAMIHALRAKTDAGANDEKARAAEHAMITADQVAVSSITVFELECGFTEAARAAFKRWHGVLRVEVVDAAIARRAAEILRSARADAGPGSCVSASGCMTTKDPQISHAADESTRPELSGNADPVWTASVPGELRLEPCTIELSDPTRDLNSREAAVLARSLRRSVRVVHEAK